jgi:hypothetical protein
MGLQVAPPVHLKLETPGFSRAQVEVVKAQLVITVTTAGRKRRHRRKVKIDLLRWLEFAVTLAALVVAIVK